MQLKHEDHPGIRKCWEDYGFGIPFEACDGIKFRRDGCYAVLRYKDPDDGKVCIFDMVRAGRNQDWEIQNDGYFKENGDHYTDADWQKLHIVPECDWFEIKGK